MSRASRERRTPGERGGRAGPSPVGKRVTEPADIEALIGAETLHAIGAHHFDRYTTRDGRRVVLRFHIPSPTPARRCLAVAANLHDGGFAIVPAYVLEDDLTPGGGPDVYNVAHGHTASCATSENLLRVVRDVVDAWCAR